MHPNRFAARIRVPATALTVIATVLASGALYAARFSAHPEWAPTLWTAAFFVLAFAAPSWLAYLMLTSTLPTPIPAPPAQPDDPADWLVWSHQHGMWDASFGYTGDLNRARRHTWEEASRALRLRPWIEGEARPPAVTIRLPLPPQISADVEVTATQLLAQATTEAVSARSAARGHSDALPAALRRPAPRPRREETRHGAADPR